MTEEEKCFIIQQIVKGQWFFCKILVFEFTEGVQNPRLEIKTFELLIEILEEKNFIIQQVLMEQWFFCKRLVFEFTDRVENLQIEIFELLIEILEEKCR